MSYMVRLYRSDTGRPVFLWWVWLLAIGLGP
jgi:hypothetical protein